LRTHDVLVATREWHVHFDFFEIGTDVMHLNARAAQWGVKIHGSAHEFGLVREVFQKFFKHFLLRLFLVVSVG
jgi:hypothetical protein